MLHSMKTNGSPQMTTDEHGSVFFFLSVCIRVYLWRLSVAFICAPLSVASHGLGVVDDRPHVDAAEPRRRDLRRPLDRVVQVARFDQVVAAELLLRFGERAVRGRDLPVAHADGGGGADRLQGVAAQVVAALLDA